MARRSSKSALFLGFLLAIGIVLIAYMLFLVSTSPPRVAPPSAEEVIPITPIEGEEPDERLLFPEEKPIVEEGVITEPVVYPYGIVPIVKNDDGQTSFDLIILHTNDIKGNIYTKDGGIGLARLSTALKAGRGVTDNWLLLNTGDVGPIDPGYAETAALVVDELGYDAYLPLDIQLTSGIQGTKALPLAINALDNDGYLLAQPYQIYDFNGFNVGVVGVIAPRDLNQITFDSDLVLNNAQYAVDYAHELVDYLVVLSDLGEGDFTASDLANTIQGIDLIIDGNGKALTKEVNNTLIVRGEEQLRSISGVVLHIDNNTVTSTLPLTLPAQDLLNPRESDLFELYEPIAQSLGYTLDVEVYEDPAIVSLSGTWIEEPPIIEEVIPEPVVTIEEEPISEEVIPEPVVTIEEESIIEEVLPEPVITIEEEPIIEEIFPEPLVTIEEEPIIEEVTPEPVVVIAEEPIVVPFVYPYGVVPIIKNDDGQTNFDLVILHTNDIKGNIYTKDGGIGLARLSTALKAGRALTDNWLLLNTGDIGPLALEYADTAALVVDELGYDAYLPLGIQLSSGVRGTIHALPLAINALDEEGYLLAQPYQVYDYNGFLVGVVGVVAPRDIEGATFDSDLVLSNAQYAVDYAHEFIDYLIILSDLGDGVFTASDLANSIDGIDLIIDGNGPSFISEVNGSLIVRGDEELHSISGVVLSVENDTVVSVLPLVLPAEDLLHPSESKLFDVYEPLAQSMGYTLDVLVDEDPAIVNLIGTWIEEPIVEELVIEEVTPEPVVITKEEPITEPFVYPYGVVPIVKNDDGQTSFDLVVVHTNDIKGNIYTKDGGIGLARLSTALKAGRALTDNWLLLNTGDVGEIALEDAETAALVVDELGYDAYLPLGIQLSSGVRGTIHALPLAINALDEEGYLLAQPYQVYDYNGFLVGVVGVVAPRDVEGATFDSDLVLSNAQYAVDYAHEFVDYLIVLSDLGDGVFSTHDLAQALDGIDLIIDGNGPSFAKEVNGSLIVRGDEKLHSISGVVLSVENDAVVSVLPLVLPAIDLLEPTASALVQAYEPFAQSLGYTLNVDVLEDPAIVELIGTWVEEEPVVEEDEWFAFDDFDWDAFDAWEDDVFEGDSIPPPPYIFEPMVFTEEEYDLFFPSATQPLSADDDFWADFFVVGEDAQVAYDDGTYYFRLFVNDDLTGTIEVTFDGEDRLMNVEDLRFYISDHLTNQARARIFTNLGAYVTPEGLEALGIEVTYDENNFVIYLTFSVDDMPERILSLTSASVNRREQYAISGAIPLKPRWFSLATSLSLYGQLEYPDDFSMIKRQLLNLSISNRASLFGVALNYNFTLSYKEPYFNSGSWSGYYDFVKSSMRLSFGNIGSGIGKVSAPGTQTSVGINLEKNYSFGTSSAKRAQIEETLTIVEESKIKIFLNDNEVFARVLKPGTYRLKDFLLVQGANRIRIEVTPTAGGDPTISYLSLGYDYRLMAKGDTTYAVGFSMPQTRSQFQSGAFSIPWLGDDYLSYHPQAFTATYRQELGITDALTMNVNLAYSPGTIQAALGAVFATMIGSTQIQGSTTIQADPWKASFNVNAGQRFSVGENSFLNRLGLSANYNKPPEQQGNASISLSYSDSLFGKLRYSVSGTGAYSFENSLASWSATASTGFSPFKGFSINGSISVSGSSDNPQPVITGQVSGSYSFSSKASISNSNSIKKDGMTSSLSMSMRPSPNDSVSLSYSGISTEFGDTIQPNFANGTIGGAWNHTGTYSTMNFRQQYSLAQKSLTSTLMLNTALAYAGGAVGLGRSVSDSFLLAKPIGLLKQGHVSIARSLDSGPTDLPRPFGSALYNGLSTNTTNSVVIFSSGPTEYSTGTSFVYSITPRGRQSYVVRLAMQPVFTVSGVLIQADGEPYSQYSSPVYRVEVDEEGEETQTRDETLYLFTDQDGRFILNEVGPGLYLFDLKVDDHWYGVRFEIPEMDAKAIGINSVLVLEEYHVGDPVFEERIQYFDKVSVLLDYEEDEDIFGVEAADEYDAQLHLEVVEQIDEETFWNTIFPPFDESDFFFGFVTDDDFFFDPFIFDDLVGDYDFTAEDQPVITAAP